MKIDLVLVIKNDTPKSILKNDLNYRKEISGMKKEMHQWQHDKILDYKMNNGGNRPILNKSDY